MDKDEKKSGYCAKCGRFTDDLKVTIDSAVSDEPVEVCPECFEEIEVSNAIYAKAVLVGGALVVIPIILILIVFAILNSVC